MTTHATPGVYYERADASPRGIPALRMDVAGFVGIARQGPVDVPVPVQSWRQFQANFGDFTGAGYLAYAVRAFFENGGRKCWVVRVASPTAASASIAIPEDSASHKPVWTVTASSPGVWGDALEVSFHETHRAETIGRFGGQASAEGLAVNSVSGFSRATLVKLSQDGAKDVLKVISDIDAANGLLLFVARRPEERLPYDAAVTGFSTTLPLLIRSVEYTALVRSQGQFLRTYEGLSLVPEHPSYGPVVLGVAKDATVGITPSPASGEATQSRPAAAPEPIVIVEDRHPETLPADGFQALDVGGGAWNRLTGGADGLSMLSVHDFIGEDVSPFDSDVARALKQRGLRALEVIDEVSIVAVPDIQIRPLLPPGKAPLPPCVPDPCLPSPPPARAIVVSPVGDLPPVFSDAQIYQVQSTMVARCEALRDRFALLDPPYSASLQDAAGAGAIRAWRHRFDSQFAALHYPWVRVVDPLRLSSVTLGGGLTRDIPPCGHVAGLFATFANDPGVHRAPANAPLAWVQDTTAAINHVLHGVLNDEGINAIRLSPGRGIRVLGARTVSIDTDWRFVNVRRLMMMIEKAIYVSTQWAVFEPNSHETWSKLRLSLTSFLITLWQRGALMGDTPAAAFYVRCDSSTNPQAAVDNGLLLAEVGVAPSQPYEFVVLRVGRADNEFRITDVGSR